MKVYLTREAKKQLFSHRVSDQVKIQKKCTSLADNALLGKQLSGEFKGLRSLKAWPYRIIYLIKTEEKEVWITSILHRQGVYK